MFIITLGQRTRQVPSIEAARREALRFLSYLGLFDQYYGAVLAYAGGSASYCGVTIIRGRLA